MRPIRTRLKLHPHERLALLMPPATPAASLEVAVWGVLIAQKVCPELRAIVPGEGDAVERVRRLLDALSWTGIVGFVGERISLEDLLSAADLGVFTPQREAELDHLKQAVRRRLPLVVSDMPAIRDVLPNSYPARFCPPQPRWVAQRLVETLEQIALPKAGAKHDSTAGHACTHPAV